MKTKLSKHNSLLILMVILFFGLSQNSYAQPGDNESKLANHYYNKGEFDKAEVYYLKLYKKHKSKSFFERYFDCLVFQEKYEEAEKEIKKQIKNDPYDIYFKFSLAGIYEKTERQSKADEVYVELIDELAPIQSRVQTLGKQFMAVSKYDYALQTYLKGKKIIKSGYRFNLELAEVYSMLANPKDMIIEYLDLLDYSSSYLKTVQAYLSRVIDFETEVDKTTILKEELLVRIQADPSKGYYGEMLIWYYLQLGEFSGAVIQAKALDKRTDQKGKLVYEIGNVCKINKSYANARKAYKYVIELGNISPYYSAAMQKNLDVSFLEVTEKGSFTKAELTEIAADFELALTDLGKTRESLEIRAQLARLYAFYMNKPEIATEHINTALTIPMTPNQKAEFKVLLGDVYIVNNRIWDASLLYMQVAKEFSEEPIGHEAKFKNAKVFYYDGEFDYAKAQLDVLKASTTKLIANNAMQLSLLLQDNLGVDTLQAPVQMYANADLLLQQNKYQEALSQLDSISAKYPFHNLTDEVLFKKAEIYQRMQNWEKAIELYNVVVQSYAHDILADDAAFRIAKIYDLNLNDSEKAAEYYKKILFEFSGSLYTAESRKRYREIKDV